MRKGSLEIIRIDVLPFAETSDPITHKLSELDRLSALPQDHPAELGQFLHALDDGQEVVAG
jgi:hypothetical protein